MQFTSRQSSESRVGNRSECLDAPRRPGLRYRSGHAYLWQGALWESYKDHKGEKTHNESKLHLLERWPDEMSGIQIIDCAFSYVVVFHGHAHFAISKSDTELLLAENVLIPIILHDFAMTLWQRVGIYGSWFEVTIDQRRTVFQEISSIWDLGLYSTGSLATFVSSRRAERFGAFDETAERT